MQSADLSSVSEEQKQQLERLHILFLEHQCEREEREQKQQQEQQLLQQQQLRWQYQDYAYQYDASLSQSQRYVNSTQAYDQSSQAYYQYYYQQQHGGGGGDLKVVEAQATEAPLLSIHLPGVPVSQEKMAQIDAGEAKATASAEGHQQNSTHLQQRVVQGHSSAHLGLSLAAAAVVAALSQLAEVAGTMGLAEKALAELEGRQHWPRPVMGPALMRLLMISWDI
ncbi:hypothetical protein Ancab_005785 [Ancistrocladus abbreviatus]